MSSQSQPLSISTGRDNEVPATPEQQKILCFLDNGTLLVSESHKRHSQVNAYTHRLIHLKRQHEIVYVTLREIAEAYANASKYKQSHRNDSTMQEYARQLFTAGKDRHASDIHIRVGADATTIFFGINGELNYVREEEGPFGVQLCQSIYIGMGVLQSSATFETLSSLDAIIRDPQKLPKGVFSMRIATTPTVDGMLMVLRLLYDDTEGTAAKNSPAANDGEKQEEAKPNIRADLAKLGMAPVQIKVVKHAAQTPWGINFFCGPTGAGKSTTLQRLLAALMYETNYRHHLLTIECPPEYPIKGAVQTPADATSEGLTAAIVRSLRLAPTIIMVGEVRDKPTAAAAIQASVTGHQVWTTMHTNSWSATFTRLLDFGIEATVLYDPRVINSITCQRLVTTLCPCCKKPFDATGKSYDEDIVEQINEAFHNEQIFVQGEGCPACDHKGYKGRALVCENLKTDTKLMRILRHDGQMEAYEYWLNYMSGKTMLSHVLDKVRAGIVDPFEATYKVGPLNAVHDALQDISIQRVA